MKIKHWGAVKGVTGSCHQLFINDENSVLIDCGLFQGADSSISKKGIDFDIRNVQVLIVTHCHIDHVGRIPYLLAAGFHGPIYATEATAILLPLVIKDALKVGVTRDKRLIDAYLAKLKLLLKPIKYNCWFDLPLTSASARARFQPAGHILGSAYIEIDIPQKPDSYRVVFSGDLGAPYTPLLPDPQSPSRADTLIIESTYGDKLHHGRKERQKALKTVIERCLTNDGTILIPAFSIGRTQELLYELEQIINSDFGEDWKKLDIIVDSPLAAKFTKHYRKLRSLWDEEAKATLKEGRHPLSFKQLITIDNHKEHIKLVGYLKNSGHPAIVISASGMCSGGRIQNYLHELLSDERTDVLFVGYQAEGTPGRDIQRYGSKGGFVRLEGRKITIKAGVYTISGYSAHADQANLVDFVKGMKLRPKHIRIVHGDKDAKLALQQKLKSLVDDVVIP